VGLRLADKVSGVSGDRHNVKPGLGKHVYHAFADDRLILCHNDAYRFAQNQLSHSRSKAHSGQLTRRRHGRAATFGHAAFVRRLRCA
jgi:hypothetical protein